MHWLQVLKNNGAAKKKGGGGKFTWGQVLSEAGPAPQALDRNDPNYDSDEEPSTVLREVALTDEEDGDEAVGQMERGHSRIVQVVNGLKADVRCPHLLHRTCFLV